MAEPLSDVVIAQVVDSPKGQKCKLTTCPLQTLLPGTTDTEINFHSAENPELSKAVSYTHLTLPTKVNV